MENIFDQEEISSTEIEEMISDITSEEVLDIVTDDDFTTADESDIEWEKL